MYFIGTGQLYLCYLITTTMWSRSHDQPLYRWGDWWSGLRFKVRKWDPARSRWLKAHALSVILAFELLMLFFSHHPTLVLCVGKMSGLWSNYNSYGANRVFTVNSPWWIPLPKSVVLFLLIKNCNCRSNITLYYGCLKSRKAERPSIILLSKKTYLGDCLAARN